VDEQLDTGAVLCRKELFFDEEKETFASTYDALLDEMKKLFMDNWKDIKAGKLPPQKQEGSGTCHYMRELEAIRSRTPFEWSESIADVKKRISMT